MPWLRKFSLVILVLGTYVACSDVAFEPIPSPECEKFREEHGANACVITPDGRQAFEMSVRSGKVDVLFVDDNSGSMYVEQQKMAEKFPHLLDEVEGLNYRMAIITTDVSKSPGNSEPRPANGNGAFQDGKFLKFPNNKEVLTNNTSNVINLFENTIEREETRKCEEQGFVPEKCPSSDERGIYALNMALDRNHKNFFREDAHLAVVILSDEDERSDGGNISGYELENYDLPKTFVSKVKQQLGPTKMVSVHAVIIDPGSGEHPKDTACFSEQNSQDEVDGHYGDHYAALARPNDTLKSTGNIVDGVVGSICANDYTKQMGDIGARIADNTDPVQLPCEPINGSLEVNFSPEPSDSIDYRVDNNNRVIFDPGLPAGVQVDLKWKCDRV